MCLIDAASMKSFLALLLLAPVTSAAMDAQQVAPGVYAFVAQDPLPSPHNQGFIANGGFIVGESAVILINPGPNRRAAEAREATVSRVSGKPITLVIDTHARPEQVLGSDYFSARGVAVMASPDTARLMGERCEQCLAKLRSQVGAEAMDGTRISLPMPVLRQGQPLGVAGRRLRLVVPERAVMPGNLAVFDLDSGVLFSGVLLSLEHVPDLREADPAGLLEALDSLAEMPIRWLVPDQGPPAGPQRIGEFRRYVSELMGKVALAYKEGVGLSEIGSAVDLPAFSHWQGYAQFHPINARAFYQRLEKADFEAR